MKILKSEQELLNERKDNCFKRFLMRCENVYENSSVWTLVSHKIHEFRSLWIDTEENEDTIKYWCEKKLETELHPYQKQKEREQTFFKKSERQHEMGITEKEN
jgi:hypothetical protein